MLIWAIACGPGSQASSVFANKFQVLLVVSFYFHVNKLSVTKMFHFFFWQKCPQYSKDFAGALTLQLSEF